MKNKILLYLELPPPMHGMTYINQIIYDNLKDEDNYTFYDTNFTVDVNEVGNVSAKKILKNISIMFRAWNSFFKCKPDKIYSILSASKFGIVRDFMINLPAMLFGRQLVLHLHGFTYYKIYQRSRLYKILFDIMNKNSTIIVLCNKQKQKTLNIMNKESMVLHNCLNSEIQDVCKNKNEILQVCYISNISKQKGTFDLIKAIQKYPKEIKLVIAGSFLSDKDEFLELIKDSLNISYVGFADETIKKGILNTSDIFCLPSKLEEGSPISIIEAMSYGLPIIATDKGCIKEMIENSGCLLTADYIYSDIINSIKIVNNSYDELSKNAINVYMSNYSQTIFIENFKTILQGEINNV